ncbi:MAG: hypothetical protein ACI9KE_004930, partial [Polyangiales bacterium]
FFAVFCVACSVDHTGLQEGDAGFDGADVGDAAVPDAAVPDARGVDAAVVDAAVVDVADAAVPDAGVVDAGFTDSGPIDAMPDTAPADAGCPIGTRECVDSTTLRVCVEGRWEERPCDFECGVDGARDSCVDLIPSNLTRPLSAVTALGTVTFDEEDQWDTDECSALDNFWYVETVAGEIDLCVLAFENVTFAARIEVEGQRGLVIVATGSITIEAEFAADGEELRPGPGGSSNVGASASMLSGGTGGVVEVLGLGYSSDGGGGGGGFFAEGGRGGPAGGDGGSTVASGGVSGGTNGSSYRLIPLRGGGAGGIGGTSPSSGLGGGGGGAIQFTARGDIIVDGRIRVSGGGGDGGRFENGGADNIGAGGGGGGGGGIHFETAGTIFFRGGANIHAGGGGGGGGGGCGDGEGGGEEEQGDDAVGGDRGPDCAGLGRISADGGDGSETGRGENGGGIDFEGGNAGGGGGGVGLVVIRADAQMGTLRGTGQRETESPTIAAVE